MKKQVFILLSILILFSISLISAVSVEINLEKEDYHPLELLQVEITGTFLDPGLDVENIGIYREGEVHKTPTDSDLLKLKTKYLYYALLPQVEGNYSIKINDVSYYDGLEVSEKEVVKNFTITLIDEPYLSLNKGFISATSDFSIIVKSLNAPQDIVATFKATGEKKEVSIGHNADKTLKFSISGIEEYTESEIQIGDYTVPIFVYPPKSDSLPFIEDKNPEDNPQDTDPETEQDTEIPEEITLEEATTEQIQTCADINAKICKSSEKCVGPSSYAKDVPCCEGVCEEKPNSFAWIGGILILILLGVGGWWFYKKYKLQKATGGKSREDILKERANKYNLRMTPDITPKKEVRKGLSKV